MKFFNMVLSSLFPVRIRRIKPKDLQVWLKYVVANHSELDPLRPLGYFDSWAGNRREYVVYTSAKREHKCRTTI